MKSQKIVCIITILMLMFSTLTSVYGAQPFAPNPVYEQEHPDVQEKFDADSEVTFIVEIEGDPVLAGKKAAELGTDFIYTNEGQNKEDAILEAQDEVIDKIGDSAKVEAVYTMLFNGFAINGTYGDMEKLKKIDGVKNVYVSEEIKLEPHLSTSVGITGVKDEVVAEYTGKGQLVAIIDSEFDVEHDVFKTAPLNPKYPTADSMATLLRDKGLSSKYSASKAFVSAKIPFAYDYGSSDYDTYATSNIHGTHVASIVGGNSSSSKGVAPDAQLVLMKIATSAGTISESKSFLALEDAVKLGVSTINCSFGADYISPSLKPVWETNYRNARNAGILICVSSGNKGRGYSQKTPLVTDVDYGTAGIPATTTSVMAVGSASKSNSNYGNMASSSSYGVNENLDIKPEITAPGASIYAAVPNNKYAYKSGTSMASPHMTGVVAVLNEYFDKNYPDIIGVERVSLIENLLMSTAEPIKKSNTGVYYSPRVQGAGGVKASNAVKTPVVLVSSSGKSKLNLGHRLAESFDVNFSAKNIGTQNASYNKVSLVVLTDGYTLSGGKYYVSDSVEIPVDSHTLPSALEVGAGQTTQISAKINLNKNKVDSISQIFTNGFYVDGFIRFENTEGTVPPIGIPFMGFYGDWTKAGVFDNTIYDEGGSKLQSVASTLLFTKVSGANKTLGSNGASAYSTEYIALSPNGDGNNDTISLQLVPMRTISKITSVVTDTAGNTKTSTKTSSSIYNKFNSYTVALNSITSLAEGDYKMRINATYNYSTTNPTSHVLEIPFYIDKQPPEILTAKVNGSKVNATFRDNKHLSYVYTYYEDANGTIHSQKINIVNPTEGETLNVEFDLSKIGAVGVDYKDVYIFAHDNAENYYVNSLSCLTGDIHPIVAGFTASTSVYSLELDIVNYKSNLTASMILAFYSNDGTLIHAETKNNVSIKNGKSSHTFASLANIKDAKSCRLFIWNNATTISPIEMSKTIDISE